MRLASFSLSLLIVGIAVLLCAGCSNQEEFTQQGTTEYFLQDFNPESLDVLWVVNDQSAMYRVRDHLLSEAKKFFVRLDGISSNYQMAVITSDMRIARGQIQPIESPIVLKKNVGNVESRAQSFASLLGRVINLETDYQDKGFEAAWTALNLHFKPRANIPLVLVFISDSNDHSDPQDGTAVDAFTAKFVGLKNGNKDLVRVYSINYKPLNGAPKSDENRCATLDIADIDVQAGFDDRYFKLAKALGGVAGEKATGDLCQSFADQIDLAGLREKELPRTFKLSKKPLANSLVVSIYKTSTKETFDIPWTYDAERNEVSFERTPPDGTTIQVTYHSGS